MVLKIYKGGELYETGEKKQLIELIDLLTNYFNEKDRDVFLYVDPKLNGVYSQIDCVFYRQGKITILELKNIMGDYIPNTNVTNWKLIKDGKEEDFNQKNPFSQVKIQRSKLTEYLCKLIDNGKEEKGEQGEPCRKRISKYVSAWIVTASDSRSVKDVNSEYPWFKVLPMGKDLAIELSKNTTGDRDAIISEDKFKHLLEENNAKETNRDDIFFRVGVPGLELGRVPLIETLLESDNDSDLVKAVKYSKELILIKYFDKLKNISQRQPDNFRYEITSILFDWSNSYKEKFKKIEVADLLKYTINDNYFEIRKLALSFLISNPSFIDEGIGRHVCESRESEKYFNLIELNIQVLEHFKNKKTAQEQLELYYKRIESNFFIWEQQYRKLNEEYTNNLKPSKQDYSEEQYEKYNSIKDNLSEARTQCNGWTSITETWIEVCSKIGNKQIGEIILSHGKKVVEVLGPLDSDYYSPPTLLESIKALGKLKPDGSEEFLLQLRTSSIYGKILLAIIEALGNFSSIKSLYTLREYLDFQEPKDWVDAKFVKIGTSYAISKRKDMGSFEKIWTLFMNDEARSLTTSEGRSFFNSLLLLDQEQLERNLWKLISDQDYSKEVFKLYYEFILKSGDNFSIDQSDSLISVGKIDFDDYYGTPKGVLSYLVRNLPQLRDKGIKLGLKYLETGRKDLEDLGIDLAEPYFLEHPEKLEKYEKSEMEGTSYELIMIYSKLKRLDKIEMFARRDEQHVSRIAFNQLKEMISDKYFEYHYLFDNNQMHSCKFIIGESGLFIQSYRIGDYGLESENITHVTWDKFVAVKKIAVENHIIGIITSLKEKPDVLFVIISRSAVTWDNLIERRSEKDKGFDMIISKIKNKDFNIEDKSEIVATSETLFKILSAAFEEDEDIKDMGDERRKAMAQMFESRFKPDMMRLD